MWPLDVPQRLSGCLHLGGKTIEIITLYIYVYIYLKIIETDGINISQEARHPSPTFSHPEGP